LYLTDESSNELKKYGPRSKVLGEILESVFDLGGDVKGIAAFARVAIAVDDDLAFPTNNKVKLILIVEGLMIGAVRGEEDEPDALFLKRLNVPDAFRPFLVRQERKLRQVFVDGELHIGKDQ